MKTSVIREMSTQELNERLEEERKQYLRMKMNHAVSPLDNPKKIGEGRKVIARILTELRKRELENK